MIDGNICGVQLWVIWNCKNQSIFQNKRWNRDRIIQQILFFSWAWIKGFDFAACIGGGPSWSTGHRITKAQGY
ncbi:hypothetical protein JHK82_026527 [Glycine max]|nr:hypothetical protein JHK85_027143 [Glycine max]KAG5002511.1 hypothetical protein JHK86_026650 [Glycine max]KAG5125692.1 hypothetical protein JHK82_026527 [Glycine max]KAG5150292.1 hypothetical protein JHK84_026764 [Glycine max]